MTAGPPKPSRRSLKSRIRTLHEGQTEAADRFRYGLPGFDLLTIAFLITTSFVVRGQHVELLDMAIGLVILTDVAARPWISPRPLRDLLQPYGLADVAVILSLFAPVWGEGLAFLRVLRLFRVLHSAQTLRQLREDLPTFRRNESTLRAAANLCVFIFLMTALVYQTRARSTTRSTPMSMRCTSLLPHCRPPGSATSS